MKLNDAGYDLICGFEGLSLKPYLDSVKVPTIGYGNTYYANGKRVTMLDSPITKEQAKEMFKIISDKFANQVSSLVPNLSNQNKFNALVSIAYNIGIGNFRSSTLLKKVKANPNDASIRLEFLKWNKAGGKILPGLTNRRTKESNLYFTP